MEVYVLALQARILLLVGISWLAVGLWLGYDPATVAWRAALGAMAAMWCAGWLLRQVTAVIEERMINDLTERQLAEEKAAEQAQAAAAKAAAKPGARAVKGRAA